MSDEWGGLPPPGSTVEPHIPHPKAQRPPQRHIGRLGDTRPLQTSQTNLNVLVSE